MKKLLTSFLLAGLWIVGLHVNATTHYLENTNFSNGDRKLQTFGTYRIYCNNYVDASNSFGVAEIDCMPTASKYINPNMEYMADYALLDVTLEATPDEFCLGSVDLPFDLTTYLTAGTTTGGTWSSSGPDATAVVSGQIFNPTLPGTYVLTYTVGSDSESITVTVYPSIYAWLLPITVCAKYFNKISLD